jgi:O-succinylbenzoic acid--CoA ligase
VSLPDPDEWPVREPLPGESADLLRERASATPQATALVDTDGGASWTYAEFDRRVGEFAGGLSSRLDVEGERVGLLLPTGTAFATVYFALARRNGVAVPLNVRESADVLAKQAERANVEAVLCTRDTESMAREVAPADGTVLSVDDPAADDVARIQPTDHTVSARTADGDTDRLVLFTSGTTGEPKGVRLTRGNLVASAVGSAHRLGVSVGDRWLVCLPMYHMGGLAPLVRSTLYGTTTVLQRSFGTSDTARVLAEESITGVSLVPTMLTRLLDDGWQPPASLRFVLLGGAPARPELIERCEAAGVPVYPTYGTTETTSQITTATPGEAFASPETVGRPLDGTTVGVLEDGNPCDPGDVGEIVVSGPTVTPGYLDERQTAGAFDDDGFHTGDLGYYDSEGRFFVVGRVDDQIVTGGENVQPAVVQRALEELASVSAAAVVGLPDEEWGQRVAAAVVPAIETTPGRVIDAVADDLAAFAVPKTVALVEELPRTQSGTVDRERVRERLRAADSD